MNKTEGSSRWAGFSQNKKMTDFMTKSTPEQPQAVPVKEDEVEQSFEIVDDYRFEESLQETDCNIADEPVEVLANNAEIEKAQNHTDAEQSDQFVIHVYSNSVKQEELHAAPSEELEVVQPPVAAEKQEVKIVVANAFQVESTALESVDNLKEEQKVEPVQEQVAAAQPVKEPATAPQEQVVTVVDETAIRLMQELNAKVDKIESTYISRNFVEKQQEEIINALHRELMEYKEDAHKEHLKPFVKGIISMINTQCKRIRELSKQRTDEELEDPVIEELKIVVEDLENLLYPYEIDRLHVKKGDVYNAELHKTLKRVVTTNKELDRTIAGVLGYGYQWGSRVIEKASVITFVYEGKE